MDVAGHALHLSVLHQHLLDIAVPQGTPAPQTLPLPSHPRRFVVHINKSGLAQAGPGLSFTICDTKRVLGTDAIVLPGLSGSNQHRVVWGGSAVRPRLRVEAASSHLPETCSTFS